MRKLLLLFLIPGLPVCGQVIHSLPAAPCLGAGAYSLHFTDVFSPLANQASLANTKQLTAGVYGEKRFMLSELTQLTGIVAIPAGQGAIGVVMNYFGSAGYRESQVGIAYGKKLGKADLGIRFNYTHAQVSGYGNDGAISVELGSLWHITDRLHTGVQVTNPLGGKFRQHSEEKLAAIYKLGMGYEASDKLQLQAEIIKEENKPVNILATLQYRLMDQLLAKAGVATVSGSPFFGVGWQWKAVQIAVAGNYHPQLGITPGLMIIFGESGIQDSESSR